MINEVYAKDDYFRQQLLIERERILRSKTEFDQFSRDLKLNYHENNISCRKCISLMRKIDSQQIFRILENNDHVKHEYDKMLLPLQSLLILICLLNNISIILIFDKAVQLFSLSNMLLILCVCIHAEIFIEDRPSTMYTLIIGCCILFFTLFFLFKVFRTFFNIGYYRVVKNTLEELSIETS